MVQKGPGGSEVLGALDLDTSVDQSPAPWRNSLGSFAHFKQHLSVPAGELGEAPTSGSAHL